MSDFAGNASHRLLKFVLSILQKRHVLLEVAFIFRRTLLDKAASHRSEAVGIDASKKIEAFGLTASASRFAIGLALFEDVKIMTSLFLEVDFSLSRYPLF